MPIQRETWGSRFGFIMATAGFAVGLGNIWRFPYIVGQNGGGAFLLVYVAFAILIGIPLFTAEMSLGRKTQLTPIAGMRKLTGKPTSVWNLIGWLGVATAIVLTSYYVMLIAWITAYFVRILVGPAMSASPDETRALYEAFVARPLPVLAYTFVVVTVMAVLVGRGLHKGIERVAKIVMPVAVVLLILLAVRSLTFPGARAGLVWYLKPDFAALDGSAVLAALGQAFYSIGIGMAATFAYGSYLSPEKSDVPGSAAIVVAFDTSMAFLAGLVIFPALFAFGMEPDSGPGLLFITMPALFARMPAGELFGASFFFLMIIAGLTSQIALFEVMTASLRDSLGWRRTKAVWVTAVGTFALSVPIILSQGPWSHIRLFDKDLFGLADWLSGNIMLTLGAFLISLYVALVWGWERFRDETNVGSGRVKVGALWAPFVRYLIPVAVAIVLLVGLGVM